MDPPLDLNVYQCCNNEVDAWVVVIVWLDALSPLVHYNSYRSLLYPETSYLGLLAQCIHILV